MNERKPLPRSPSAASAARSSHLNQGLTLVHLSARRQRFWWDKGYSGGVQGVVEAGVEGVFTRLGDVLRVRNDSG